MAMDIISKDKKEIHWKGLPLTTFNDIEELKVSLRTFPNARLVYYVLNYEEKANSIILQFDKFF